MSRFPPYQPALPGHPGMVPSAGGNPGMYGIEIGPQPVSPVTRPGPLPGPLRPENRNQWIQPATAMLQFSAVAGEPGIVARATWETPIFNTRAELEDQGGSDAWANTYPIFRGGVFGTGLNLHAHILGVEDVGVDLAVSYQLSSHPWDPERICTVQQKQDISSDFWDGAAAAALCIPAPGGPVRFWKVALIFDQMSGLVTALDGVLRLDAAAY